MNIFKNVVIVMMIISSTVFLYGYSAKAIGKATVSEKVLTDPIAVPMALLPDTAIAPRIHLVFAFDATGSMGPTSTKDRDRTRILSRQRRCIYNQNDSHVITTG